MSKYIRFISTTGCRKRVAPEFSPFHIFPFLPEVFVPRTSRAVQTHFVPSWYKEKWKKWKGENSGATRFLQPTVLVLMQFFPNYRITLTCHLALTCFNVSHTLVSQEYADFDGCFRCDRWEKSNDQWFRQVLPAGSHIDLLRKEIPRYSKIHVCKPGQIRRITDQEKLGVFFQQFPAVHLILHTFSYVSFT